jgi:hypothetical protein
MKELLYENLARSASVFIGLNIVIGQAVTGLVGGVFNLVTFAVSRTTAFLLSKIDSDRYKHNVEAMDQRGNLIELDILMKINRVKEDALKQKVWTVMHTIAINKLGSALRMQCGWEPARIHGYIKPVIESIPGMVYMGGEEHSEDPE